MILRCLAMMIMLILCGMEAGCSHPSSSGLPTTSMRIGDKNFTLEIARTDHEQEVGLMHRDSLDSDCGMIFPSPAERMQTFWNHDVHFPLDLVFLNTAGEIVSLKQMQAYSELNVSSGVPAQYVIELNKGVVADLHLTRGMKLDLPKEVIQPAPPATRP